MRKKIPMLTVEEICERLIDYRGKTPQKTESGVKLITAKVIKGGRIENSNHEYIAEEEYDDWMRRGLPQEGDVLVTTEAPLGEVAPIPTDERIALAQRVILLRPNTQICNSAYLLYAFQTPQVQSELNSRASGCTVVGIRNAELRKVRVAIPSLREQQTIGSILTAYDNLIENNRRRMALLEESARLLYREWFVHLRFPGHATARVSDGIPKGWRKVGLGEVAAVNRENLKKGFEGEIEYIDIATVSPGEIGETCVVDFDESPSRARRVVRHGDIIWSCVRPNRRSHAVIWNPAENLIASTGFAVLSPKAVPTTFLYGAVTTDDFVGYLENHARGAAYPAVVASDFERAEILVPAPEVLGDFDAVVSTIFDQLHVLRAQTQKLKTARDLLLPKLMSGDIEV